MRLLLGSIALGCCTSLGLAAEPTPPAAAAPTVDGLVQKLGSDSFAEREAAGKALLKIGPTALNAVKLAAASHADPEVRERAAALLEPLSKAQDSTKLLTVKTVRIEYAGLPLSSVINDFKTKTGLPLLLDKTQIKNESRLVTVPAGEYTPWEALEVVLKAAGLREDHRTELPAPAQPTNQGRRYYRSWDNDQEPANYSANTAPLILVDGESDSLPATRSGAVRVTALPPSFSKNRVIRGAGRIEFHLDVAPQPGLGWNSATGVRVTHAEDEDGRPIFSDLKLAYDPLASSYDSWNGGWGWRGRGRVFFGGGGWAWTSNYYGSNVSANENPRLIAVSLRTNDRAVSTLRKFEGMVMGDVHTPNVPIITIDNLEAAHSKSFSGPLQSNLTIEEAKRATDGSFTLKFKYESLTSWALQQQGGGMAGNFVTASDNPSDVLTKIKYYDTDGKALPMPTSRGNSTSSDGFRQSCEVTYQFKKTEKPPVKMVIHGTKVTAVEVPFRMVNVRVP